MLQTRHTAEGLLPSHMALGALPDNDTSSAHSDQSITTPSTSPLCVSEEMDSPGYSKGLRAVAEPLDLLPSVSALSVSLQAMPTPSVPTASCDSLRSGPPTMTTAGAAAAAAAVAEEAEPLVDEAPALEIDSETPDAGPDTTPAGPAGPDTADASPALAASPAPAEPPAEVLADIGIREVKENEVLFRNPGTPVGEGHENFVTAYNMLTGIRYAVSQCNAKIKRDLLESDFYTTAEMSFDMSNQNGMPSSKFMFRFKDYSPWVFRHLRELFGLDPADYLVAMTAKLIVNELGSPGKSGSFFYYSRDYRFIIKTIRHSEHKQLRSILKLYYQHVRDNPNTLISQFYGLHRVKLPFGRKIHFVVMNNVFPASHEIHRRYDLKGSTLGRKYVADECKPMVVLKDLDWLQNHERIVLGPRKREQFMRQLELDVQMLQRANVMDYSLLIGIHDKAKGNSASKALARFKEFGPTTDSTDSQAQRRVRRRHQEQVEFAKLQRQLQDANPQALTDFSFDEQFRARYLFYRDSGGFESTDPHNEPRDIIYYMGIIDFLTGYSLKKRVETFCKSLVHRRSELSAVPAFEYGDRFFRFLCLAVGSPIERSKRRVAPSATNTTAAATVTTADAQEHPAVPDEANTPDDHSPSLVRVVSNASQGSLGTAVSTPTSGQTAARPALSKTSSRSSIIAYR